MKKISNTTSPTFLNLVNVIDISPKCIGMLIYDEFMCHRTEMTELELLTLAYKFDIPQLDTMLNSISINNQY